MFIPGYHNSYPPIVDAYGNRRFWPDYRGAFVGTQPTPGLGATPTYFRMADAQTHDLRTAMGIQDTVRDPSRWARLIVGSGAAPVHVPPAPAPTSSSNVPLIVGGVVAVTVLGLIFIAAAR